MSAEAETMGIRVDPDVFVSYRRTDKDLVKRFVTALEGHGPEVWWDADIGAGDDWRESIVEHLADSDCLVIVFSKDCNDSTQLVKELAVADHLKKVVIPVKIDDAEPTGSFLYELAWRSWIDVYPDPMSKLDTAAARIVENLKETGWTPLSARSRTPPDPTGDATSASTASAAGLAPPRPPQPWAAPGPVPSRRPAPAASIDASQRLMADSVPASSRFRLREAFPFHWADVVAPVLLFGVALFAPAEEGQSFVVTLGDALLVAVMLLAAIGLIAFPIRYYRRRANPYRVARNLVISNLTFAVGGALAGLLTASSLVEEGETTGSVQIDLAIGFLLFGLVFAVVSFVIFFALSKTRATRELRSHMETV